MPCTQQKKVWKFCSIHPAEPSCIHFSVRDKESLESSLLNQKTQSSANFSVTRKKMVSFFRHIEIARVAIGSFGMILNMLQLILMVRSKKTKLAFDITILSLDIADIFASICFIMDGVYEYFSLDGIIIFSKTLRRIASIGLYFSIYSSFFHALLIAMQRLFAVFFPMKFQKHFTKRSCITCLVITWILSLILSVLTNFFKFSRALLPRMIVSIGVLLSMFYIMICWRLHSQRRRVYDRRSSTLVRRNNWVLQYSVIVTVGFVACTFPFGILLIRRSTGTFNSPKEMFEISRQLRIASMIITLNPTLDTLLYLIAHYKRKFSFSTFLCGTGDAMNATTQGVSETTMNLEPRRICRCFTCCRRNMLAENTTITQERDVGTIEMKEMNENPADIIDKLEE